MRLCALLLLPLLAACVIPRPSVINSMMAAEQKVPPPGTDGGTLRAWFAAEGYVAGPNVLQSRAELARRPGDPLVYATQAERQWWLSQQQTVHDLCITSKVVYYRVTADGALVDAVPTVRSTC